jgi:hypothetical protein
MENYSFFPQRYRRRTFLTAVVVSSIFLMFVSVNHLHYKDQFSCYGLAGAGHPVDFLCDYSDGARPFVGSSPNSVGKIDFADVPYISLQGVYVDLLFYCIFLLTIWFILTYSIHLARRKNRN